MKCINMRMTSKKKKEEGGEEEEYGSLNPQYHEYNLIWKQGFRRGIEAKTRSLG